MAKIYELVSDQLCLYVGKTGVSLGERASRHRCKGNTTFSRHIPDYTEWDIKLIEECDDAVATEREQYWYDTKKPLYNYKRPGQTEKERNKRYRQTEAGRKYHRESNKRYRLKKKAQEISLPQTDGTPPQTL
jgi:transketolase C-terminal domain/subunit